MPVNQGNYEQIVKELAEKGVTLVAVSKTKPPEDIQTLQRLGQVDFRQSSVWMPRK
ncbi:MAG: YggS family pyridoxal phosphate-dependent enzyme [Chitinophagaceae bacterium]|nr:YggS family pyridoxal phosphate-dependent enzyme [Chitinophagaceae bacterium]